jgi:hypothetical protein
MKCPGCGWVAEDPSMNIIGQSMCPTCGNLLEYTDIISDEVNGAEYYGIDED